MPGLRRDILARCGLGATLLFDEPFGDLLVAAPDGKGERGHAPYGLVANIGSLRDQIFDATHRTLHTTKDHNG